MKTKNLILFAIFIATIGKAQFCITQSSTAQYNINSNNLASLASADFNGDGIKDLVTANSQAGDLSILLGTGVGIFSSGVTYSIGFGGTTSLTSVTTADFDGDLDVDIAVTNYHNNEVYLLINNGLASFTLTSPYSSGIPAPGANVLGTRPTAVIAKDVDNNGSQDLVVANSYNGLNPGGSVSILLNPLGDGIFSPPINYPTNFPNTYDVVSADFNGDGFKDLATAAKSTVDNISVFIHSGVGAIYNSPVVYTSGDTPWSLTAADLDGDGDVDLAVPNAEGHNTSIFLNSGSGAFAPPVSYILSSGSTARLRDITHGDYDNDGDIDLAISDGINASFGDGNVTFLKNNGVGVFSAVSGYTVNSGPNTIITEDFDNNGTLDLAIGSAFNKWISFAYLTSQVAISLNQAPSLTLSATNTVVCASSSAITLTGFPTGGVYSGINVTGNSFNPISSGTFSPTYSYTNSANGCSNVTTTTIVVNTCTSLEDIASSVYPDFKLYPNPSNGIVTVEAENELTLNVHNFIGELKYHKTINGNQTVDLSGLEKGVYFLTLIDNQNSRKTIKLILE
jgi:hypothetical protein